MLIATVCKYFCQLFEGLDDDDDSEDLPSSSLANVSEAPETRKSSNLSLESYQAENLDYNLPKQKFNVSREDGMDDLKRDILSCYKQPECNLKAPLRVRFEGEDGVGNGPIREFLLCAMKIVEEGLSKNKKPLVFFYGEDNHLLPIHDQAFRCTGVFKAIGRIIGHSVLHGGPLPYGFSPAILHYWHVTGSPQIKDKDIATHALPIVPEDIADLELREMITEVCTCKHDPLLFVLLGLWV